MRARRLRRATVEGRVFTVRALKKIIVLEKLFTIIIASLLCFGFGYTCIAFLDRDVTAMFIIIPICLYMIFSRKYRIPVLKICYNLVDEFKEQEVYNTKYEDYDRYYEYEDNTDDGLY